jgi:hypothetical protein
MICSGTGFHPRIKSEGKLFGIMLQPRIRHIVSLGDGAAMGRAVAREEGRG